MEEIKKELKTAIRRFTIGLVISAIVIIFLILQ